MGGTISILLLSAGLVGQAFHIHWVFKRHLELRRRVMHLELALDNPGYWESHFEEILRDRLK